MAHVDGSNIIPWDEHFRCSPGYRAPGHHDFWPWQRLFRPRCAFAFAWLRAHPLRKRSWRLVISCNDEWWLVTISNDPLWSMIIRDNQWWFVEGRNADSWSCESLQATRWAAMRNIMSNVDPRTPRTYGTSVAIERYSTLWTHLGLDTKMGAAQKVPQTGLFTIPHGKIYFFAPSLPSSQSSQSDTHNHTPTLYILRYTHHLRQYTQEISRTTQVVPGFLSHRIMSRSLWDISIVAAPRSLRIRFRASCALNFDSDQDGFTEALAKANRCKDGPGDIQWMKLDFWIF